MGAVKGIIRDKLNAKTVLTYNFVQWSYIFVVICLNSFNVAQFYKNQRAFICVTKLYTKRCVFVEL